MVKPSRHKCGASLWSTPVPDPSSACQIHFYPSDHIADTCELCGSREKVEVHHIRHLKDLRRKGRADQPAWVKQMAARRRKTLIVCRTCHEDIHAGRPTRQQRMA